MKNLMFKVTALKFHDVLEFIAHAPMAFKKIKDLKDRPPLRRVKLAFVDAALLQEELVQSGTRWSPSQSPLGGAFFHDEETVVMLLKGQELGLAALILVHELAHVRDIEYSLNREKQSRLANELKTLGRNLLDRQKTGYEILELELSLLGAKRKDFDFQQAKVILNSECVAFEETRLFIEEFSQNQAVDSQMWLNYLLELRQKGHALFPLPGESVTAEKRDEEIIQRYLSETTVKNQAA